MSAFQRVKALTIRAFDGYAYDLATLYHHLNLGWSGYGNAWYALPLVDPNGMNPYTAVRSAVYNISTDRTGEWISGRVMSAGAAPLAGAVVTAIRSGGGAYTATTDVHGIYALAGLPPVSSYSMSVSKPGYPCASKPVNRIWYQPDAPGSNGFFRLRGTLLE